MRYYIHLIAILAISVLASCGEKSSSKAMSDQMAALSADISSLHQENSELKSEIYDLQVQVYDMQVLLKEIKDDKAKPKITVPPVTNQNSLTAEQQSLIDKLKGETFTMADVTTAKTLLQGTGQDALIKDAEACLRIINLKSSEKQQVGRQGSIIYNLTVKNLGHHKTTMLELINDKHYTLITKQDFKSIKEFKDYLDKELD